MADAGELRDRAGTPRRVAVDGVDVAVVSDEQLLDHVLVPVLERFAHAVAADTRTFLFLAAPPATGKSTLAALLRDRASHLDFDVIGLDGFHHPQSYLDSTWSSETPEPGRIRLSTVKGSPETFDLAKLTGFLEAGRSRDLLWPIYDRSRHDVVEAAKLVRAKVVLVEGNWLLLNEPGWDALTEYSAYNIFVDAEPDLLRERLIARKIRGGMSPAAAVDYCERSDLRNVRRVRERSDRSKIDLFLRLTAAGAIELGEIR